MTSAGLNLSPTGLNLSPTELNLSSVELIDVSLELIDLFDDSDRNLEPGHLLLAANARNLHVLPPYTSP